MTEPRFHTGGTAPRDLPARLPDPCAGLAHYTRTQESSMAIQIPPGLVTVKLDWPDLAGEAYRLVVAIDGEELTGAQKRKRVIDALVPLADRAVRFGGPLGAVLELVDGLVARLILRGVVEGALAAHRAIERGKAGG